MGNAMERLELLLVAVVVALVLLGALLAGLVRPRAPLPVAAVEPVGRAVATPPLPTSAPTTPPTVMPTAAPTTPPTVAPTTAPTTPPTVAPTTVPTLEPTAVPTTEPLVAETAAPARALGGRAVWWWLGGGTVVLGSTLGMFLLRRRRRSRPVAPATLPIVTVRPVDLPRAASPVALLDERPALPTLALDADRSAYRAVLSQSLLTALPDEALETGADDLPADDDSTRATDSAYAFALDVADATLPLVLGRAITAALAATGARSVWLGLRWRGRTATALFAFADDADTTLLALAEAVAAATEARCRWRADGLQITLPSRLPDGSGPWPWLVPILRGERGATVLLALDRWRHLALYGGQAVGAAHQVVSQLITTHAPAALAVTLIDPDARLGTWYGTAPHVVSTAQPPALILGQCLHALRHGHGSGLRPLLLVVVEPDDAVLTALLPLLRWLLAAPHAPLHLLLVATTLRPAGRDVYALLPALITAGGQGDARLLPGTPEQWPSVGQAVVQSRACRWSGAPVALDEATVAATVAQLPRVDAATAAPTLWQVGGSTAPVPPSTVQTPTVPRGAPPSPLAMLAPAHVAPPSPLPDTLPAAEPALPTTSVPGARPDRALDRLTALIADAPAVPRLTLPTEPPEAAPDAADAAWPTDLAPAVRAGDLRQLWTAILDDGAWHPALRGGNGSRPGLTLKRLRRIASPQLQDHLPRVLAWFDQAQLLEPPLQPDVPFGMPRLPVSTDLAWIAQQLTATAPPAETDPLVLALGRKRGATVV